MGTVYITAADIARFGVNGAALDGIPSDTIDDACSAVSAEADSAFRSRYNLPITAWGDDVRSNLSRIAAYELLVIRGFNPELGADQNLQMRADQARAWLKAVARQEYQADVTPSPPQVPEYDEPRITTQPPLWTRATRLPRG